MHSGSLSSPAVAANKCKAEEESSMLFTTPKKLPVDSALGTSLMKSVLAGSLA